ncbi:acetyl-CoA acetyltransferase [Geothrix limicola]|uniref:Acetyl-CoA acetyltransferase n=1 Tax=Geothrix limicola TaxID=2927978 RepID=A0ABQ5QDF1_9BACT|nr:thiolase family protein [Geothrix limicola]GLH72604.1 acetyl-CoA acetyltransferase [Geothrix limicola]
MKQAQDPVILAARRLPQGRYGGSLAGQGAVGLGLSVVEDLLGDPALPRPGSLLWGMARSHTQGMNPARTLALKAGLPHDTPAFTVNMACGSSLQALILAAQRLREAEAPVLIGGSEAMSDTPHLVPGLRWGFRMGHRQVPDVMHQDGLRCPVTGLLMGETIERLVAKRGITRLEADAWAAEGHRRAAQADFRAELVPHPKLDHDESIRPDLTEESLARLAPVFDPQGQLTAGNASALSDGAASLLVARRDQAGDAKPLARILGWSEAGVDPMDMGEAPVAAVRRLLAAQGLSLADVDLWELNEAFSAQLLVCQRHLEIPPERLNVAGGGVALGHPIGASGARIVCTLVHQLRRRGGGLGVATIGIGGGLGLALLIETEV